MNLGFLQGLAGAMGGLQQGLDTNRQIKEQKVLEFQRKKQMELQQQQQEFEQIKAAMEGLQGGDEVDPDLASRASRFGFQPRFVKDPVTGTIRAKSRLEDDLNQTRLMDQKIQMEVHQSQLGLQKTKAEALRQIQSLGPKGLLALPEAERQYLYSMAGVDDMPQTPEEQLRQAQLKGIPGQMQAQAYAVNDKSQKMPNLIQLRDQALQELKAAQGAKAGLIPINQVDVDNYVKTVLVPRYGGGGSAQSSVGSNPKDPLGIR